MRKKIIILSDLWGTEKAHWISHYTLLLKEKFDITFYDCCELGKVDKSNYIEESLHKQFINGGIKKAIQNLTNLEKDKTSILSFSIGGTIAWKYAMDNTNIESLYCVSSTRLRYEENKPRVNGQIELYFGENDLYKPQSKWFSKMKIHTKIIPNVNHSIYTDVKFANLLSERILEN